ncbi:NPCBM/NEW2 domain-containing protein [Deinococcus sp.]|uniref:NPCBM/NEW2 domain-containing protein n=1 Tax=Deinococcus sp. TaxID=47478 RepID=UPI003B5A904B
MLEQGRRWLGVRSWLGALATLGILSACGAPAKPPNSNQTEADATPWVMPGGQVSPLVLDAGDNTLSFETPTAATNGYGPFEKNRSNGGNVAGDGKPLTLNGTVYPTGFGVHAASDLTFNIGGQCATFTAQVGVDDEVGNLGSVVFQVFADGTKLYDSGTMTGASATKSLSVSVAGKQSLKLVVTDAGDGRSNDHADWVTPKVLGCVPAATGGSGLTGDYYDNQDFTGTKVTRIDATVDKNFGAAAPVAGIAPNSYSVRWTGQVQPKYSETYTFTTTADDGVRLMVNGQVLVDNWVNQGPTSKSGTIALKAGVKYDIRLEYYQASSGASVKLEWQSGSQTRQVVPQSQLSPLSSDLISGLKAITSNPAFNALNVTLDENMIISNRSETANALTIFAMEKSSNNFVFGGSRAGKLDFLFRYSQRNGKGTYSDLLSGKSLDLGDMSSYVNADGTHSNAQETLLAQKFVSFFSEGALGAKTGVVSGQNLQPQGLTKLFWCNDNIIPPPPTCGNFCRSNAEVYRDTICSAASLPTEAILGVVSGGLSFIPNLSKFWSTATKGFGLFFGGTTVYDGVVDTLTGDFNFRKAWIDYLNCIQDQKLNDCIPEVSPFPQNTNITAFIGASSTFDTLIGAKVKDSGVLDVKTTFKGSPGLLSGNESFRLAPGYKTSVGGTYICVSEGTLTGTISFLTNAQNIANPYIMTITVKCVAKNPKISDPTPNPVNISANVGDYATGTFGFQNTVPDSLLTYTVSGSAGLKIGNGSGSLKGNETATVTVGALCEKAGTFNYTATVKSSDPVRGSLDVRVIAVCKAPIDYGIRSLGSANLVKTVSGGDGTGKCILTRDYQIEVSILAEFSKEIPPIDKRYIIEKFTLDYSGSGGTDGGDCLRREKAALPTALLLSKLSEVVGFYRSNMKPGLILDEQFAQPSSGNPYTAYYFGHMKSIR